MSTKNRENSSHNAAARVLFAILVKLLNGEWGKWKLPEPVIAQLRALGGLGGHPKQLLSSDLVARWFLDRTFARRMLQMAKEHPGRRYFLGTFIDDCGTTSDRVPVVRMTMLGDKVRRGLDKHKAQGIAVFELHPLMNHPRRGLGRSLLCHYHVVFWMDRADFDHVAMENELNASRAFKSSLGAKPVDIRPIADTPKDLARVCHYINKPPHSAKNRMPEHNRPGQFILMDTKAGLRGELAMRVMEVLSQIGLMDRVIGVGKEGAALRRAVLNEVRTWHSKREAKGTIVEATVDVWKLWYDVRKAHGSANYVPCRVDTLVTVAPSAAAFVGATVSNSGSSEQTDGAPGGPCRPRKPARLRRPRRLRRGKRLRNKPHSLTGRRKPVTYDDMLKSIRERLAWARANPDDL